MKHKKAVFWGVSCSIMIVAILTSYWLRTDRIYTHFFYIPIALSAVVYPKYTVLMGVLLAGIHLSVEMLLRDNIEVIALLRAGIMILVSYCLFAIWQRERDYREAIDRVDYHRYNDGLTGAYNLRHLRELDINRLWYPLTIMSIEMNDYNKILQNYGQNVADFYLAELANVLKRSIRREDQLIRVSETRLILIFEHTEDSIFKQAQDRIQSVLFEQSYLKKHPDLFPEPLKTTIIIHYLQNAKAFDEVLIF